MAERRPRHRPLESAAEGQVREYKSLDKVDGPRSDFSDLAATCVCFANGAGGCVVVGIEDGHTEPPAGQSISEEILDRIRKRVRELTVNVDVVVERERRLNGGEVAVLIVPRAVGVASTRGGHFFLRVGDTCVPITGDDVLRLANERPTFPWESMTSAGVPRGRVDASKQRRLLDRLRASDRVKSSVREKNDDELLSHYTLVHDGLLTNLGILLLGEAADRARLGTAPVVQALRYDDRGSKVGKVVWDDYTLSPVELVDAIWRDVADFRESYELPEGLFRVRVPAYDEAVVRELLVNALVHRPYTQRGDIFLNLHPDRLEVVNAGRLPFGVTPKNILHASRRRNDALARIFHDLGLMEREGSGFDLLYDRLLTTGRVAPSVSEGVDSVTVVVPRRIVHPGVIRLIADADQRYQLSQRERIALGILSRSEGMFATALADALALSEPVACRSWIARLIDLGVVHRIGRTSATRYFVEPSLLRGAGLTGPTTLTRIEPHRLRALIAEDLGRYPDSAASQVHARVGPEIPARSLRRALEELLREGTIMASGERRWRRYSAVTKG